MRLPLVVLITLAIAVLPPRAGESQSPADLPFRNPDLPIEQRVDDLLQRLTLDEKVSLMIERAAPIERLGIPAFPWWNEALHGVARAGRATVFPQAIGLAATWDTDLVFRVASAIGDEARAMNNRAVARNQRHLYQGLTFWSPNINIFRDPRWGRGQETYGEDPVLTGALGVAFVKGMQGDHPRYLKTIATPKHYAVHSGPEPDRHTFDARPTDVDLHDTYLPAFRATVVEGRAGSVMCAYNAFRGLPACGSRELLNTILREQWKFDGYVVSDCSAVRDIWNQHKARATPMEAAVMALLAGTDLECGSGSWTSGHPDLFLALGDAVAAGLVKETDIDRALRRLVIAQMRLGAYDPPARVPFSRLKYEDLVDSPKHNALALEAARKSIVLLKNENNTLPLRKDLGSLAVIGPNGDDVEVLVGNYAGTPVRPVSLLRGIQDSLGPATRVVYARGSPLADGIPDLRPVPAGALTTEGPGGQTAGLTGSYYGAAFAGAPVATRIDPAIDFDWADGAPVEGLDPNAFSVRWSGRIHAPVTGRYTLGLRGANAVRLFVDNRLVAHARSDHEPPLAIAHVTLRAGHSYPIRIEVEHEKYDAIAALLWELPEAQDARRVEHDAAVEAAKAADTIVVALGLSARLEGEEMDVPVEGFLGGDRTSLDLPAAQRTLLEDVVRAAGSKPVVLVLLSGSALAIGWADEHVPAIVQAWYPGQAGGIAVADVLFGNVSPAGRLPVTFYRSVDQLPPFDEYSMENRTYRYFTGEPLYPFGHGLSYSRFEYSRLAVPAKWPIGSALKVSVEVRNVGALTADEVVQLYLAHDRASAGPDAQLPIRALKAFQRVSLKANEHRLVTFTLEERDVSVVGANGERTIRPGRLMISVGGRQPDERITRRTTSGSVSGVVEMVGQERRLER
jgi:beta-glucosidase